MSVSLYVDPSPKACSTDDGGSNGTADEDRIDSSTDDKQTFRDNKQEILLITYAREIDTLHKLFPHKPKVNSLQCRHYILVVNNVHL